MRRNRRHEQFIRSLPCVVCSEPHTQAAHIRKGTNGGTGLKPTVNFLIPLCHKHHSEQHAIGEISFWGGMEGVERAIELANALYLRTGDEDTCLRRMLRFKKCFTS